MNCKNVEPLLPLYVGNDLEEGLSQLVVVHLQSCTECTLAEEEYAGARDLLQRYDPPFFSDEIYAGIREQVLNQIQREVFTPVEPGIISQLFLALVQPRMRWVTAALVLAISMIALYLSHRPSQQLPNDQPVAVRTPEFPQNRNESAAWSSPVNKWQVRRAITRRRITGKRKLNTGVIATNLLHELKRITNGDPSVNGPLLLDRVIQSQPSSPPATLRVELQTNDRNIRIIWLVGQRPGADGDAGSKGK
jgi:hypothetical protein